MNGVQDTPSSRQLREYQKNAIRSLSDFVKSLIRGTLSGNGKFPSASLMEMATGSGKTFTTGKFLEKIIRLRDRYNRLFQKNAFQNLSIVVLTNRIDGLEQFRDDFIHGRTGEKEVPPILSSKVLAHIRSQTFHSQADDLGNLQVNKDFDKIEGTTGAIRDNFYFSTCQTASLKDLPNRLPYIDIILIDEAHNVGGENEFKKLVSDLSTRGRDGKPPHIIPITATPSNVTTELFGEPIFQFSLPEYLASSYSPQVKYKLITNVTTSREHTSAINAQIERARGITDISVKKQALKDIEEQFDAMMVEYPETDSLVRDILDRIGYGNGHNIPGPTIIFASSIEEADTIAKSLNTQTQKNIALAYHSGIRSNNALSRLADKKDDTQFVVAIDKLNESIDLPVVENIVFWRGTDSARIFLQQFGRGLRGDGVVQYYDYVGGIKNFAWIGNIYQEYRSCKDAGGSSNADTGGDFENLLSMNDEKFHISVANISTSEHDFDLGVLGLNIAGLRESIVDLTEEIIQKYFRDNGTLTVWKKKKGKERNEIKIHGHGLIKIASIMEVEGNPCNNQDVWFELLEKVFDVTIEREKSELTADMIQKYLRDNGTLAVWKKRKDEERKKIKIHGHGLIKIARIMGVEGNPYNNKDAWLDLLEKVFDVTIEREGKEEKSELTANMVQKYFKENGTLEEWQKKTQKERKDMKIHGHGLIKIASIMEVEGNPIGYQDAWLDLLEKVFDVTIEREEEIDLTVDMIHKYLRDNGTLAVWKNKKSKERNEIKIHGHGLIKIASIMEVEGNPIGYQDAWLELLEKVFDVTIEKEEEIDLTADMIHKYLRDNGTLAVWKNKKSKERKKIKIHGHGLIKIASIMEVEGNPCNNQDVWFELLEKVFDVTIEREKSELTADMIQKYLRDNGTLAVWKKRKDEERKKIKIHGHGLIKIARIMGVEGNPYNNKDAWLDLLEKIFSDM